MVGFWISACCILGKWVYIIFKSFSNILRSHGKSDLIHYFFYLIILLGLKLSKFYVQRFFLVSPHCQKSNILNIAKHLTVHEIYILFLRSCYKFFFIIQCLKAFFYKAIKNRCFYYNFKKWLILFIKWGHISFIIKIGNFLL